jgi:glycosyltransferase involved in cell wall biosynthesis
MLQLARALQRLGADVEVLSLNPRKQSVDMDAARQALAPLPFDAIDIDTSAHVRGLLRSFVLRAPLLVARFYSPLFDAALRARLHDRDFEVVQIESPFLLPYVRSIRESSGAAVVLRSLNVEFRIWERLAAREASVVRREALGAIARSLRRYEIAQLNACDAVVPITEADADDFRALGCRRPIYVLPGGVEISPSGVLPSPDSGSPAPPTQVSALEAPRHDGGVEDAGAPHARAVGFLGSLDYRPNQEAAIWIAEELRPRLPAAIEMHIAGARAPEWLRARLGASGVDFAGEVADAGAFVQAMDVMIAPIHSGGGMRIKILEAMAAGKAVVTTTIGAEGIDVAPGVNVLVADEPEAFVAAIESLLREPSRARAIGDAARALVEERYSMDAMTRGLLAFYEELMIERYRPGSLVTPLC